jgi:hypothetical protein
MAWQHSEVEAINRLEAVLAGNLRFDARDREALSFLLEHLMNARQNLTSHPTEQDWKDALFFYANENNWVDGKCDMGRRAKEALLGTCPHCVDGLVANAWNKRGLPCFHCKRGRWRLEHQ